MRLRLAVRFRVGHLLQRVAMPWLLVQLAVRQPKVSDLRWLVTSLGSSRSKLVSEPVSALPRAE